MEVNQIRNLKLPCIIHWDLDHFVVLKSVAKNQVVIHDPAKGKRKVTLDYFSKYFTGIALELTPNVNFEQNTETTSFPWIKLLKPLIGIKKYILNLVIYSIALELFVILTPFYFQWMIDQVIPSSDNDLSFTLLLAFLVISLIKSSTESLRSWVINQLCTTISCQWSQSVFSHLINLPIDWYEKRHVGDVISKFKSLDDINDILSRNFVSVIIDAFMLIITVWIMFLYNNTLTYVLIFLFTIYLAARHFFYDYVMNAKQEKIIHEAQRDSIFLETVRGVLPIKVGNKQHNRNTKFMNATVDYLNSDVSLNRIQIFFEFFNDIIFGAGRIFIIWLGVKSVIDNQFTVGMLVAFLSYSDQFISRGSTFINKYIEFRILEIQKGRLNDILGEDIETLDSDSVVPLPIDKSIELRNVSFRYSETEPWIFRDVSMKINQGEIVAITSPSGGGKTTLVKVILGLLKPTEGIVLYGGMEINKIDLANYRDDIGVVMQDDRLFAGTIFENICFFSPDFDLEHVIQAAQMAAIHDDIIQMAMGYNTLVGDMGSSLSGGQVQRILLARAFFKKANLLVLDEATSNLDVRNETFINANIKSMNKTAVVIAHRKETIESSDRIIYLSAF